MVMKEKAASAWWKYISREDVEQNKIESQHLAQAPLPPDSPRLHPCKPVHLAHQGGLNTIKD